jgi:hypothetical protein
LLLLFLLDGILGVSIGTASRYGPQKSGVRLVRRGGSDLPSARVTRRAGPQSSCRRARNGLGLGVGRCLPLAREALCPHGPRLGCWALFGRGPTVSTSRSPIDAVSQRARLHCNWFSGSMTTRGERAAADPRRVRGSPACQRVARRRG